MEEWHIISLLMKLFHHVLIPNITYLSWSLLTQNSSKTERIFATVRTKYLPTRIEEKKTEKSLSFGTIPLKAIPVIEPILIVRRLCLKVLFVLLSMMLTLVLRKSFYQPYTKTFQRKKKIILPTISLFVSKLKSIQIVRPSRGSKPKKSSVFLYISWFSFQMSLLKIKSTISL